MAKATMVTRTITSTICEVFGLNLKTESPETKSIVVPRTFKDESALLKAVKKIADNDEYVALSIKSCDVKTELRGMTEEKFIENSEILPDRPAPKSKDTEPANA
jgi:hypothetical protein